MSQIITYTDNKKRHHFWLRLISIIAGLILIYKNIQFILDTQILSAVVIESATGLFTRNEALFVLVVAIFSVTCGAFIVAGLNARLAAVIQLPVFAIGSLFIHTGHIERTGVELVVTKITPFLLLWIITDGGDSQKRINNYFLICSLLTISSVIGSL